MKRNQNNSPFSAILVGIDPGAKTGVAVWLTENQKFSEVTSMKIHKAFELILSLKQEAAAHEINLEVYCENPNTWVPFKRNGESPKGRLQGAGSIKRDFRIWQDFCKDHNIPMHSVRLQGTQKKMEASFFARITNWKNRTNEHARDAAMMVFGRR